jgi:hypothetical protein
MKKILLIILLAAAAIPFQNCSPPPEDEPPVIVDTTKTKVEPINSFKFNGITTYSLKWDSTNMYGSYRVGTNVTTVVCEGYANNKFAAFILKFPGNTIGSYKFSTSPEVNIEVTTGQNVTEKKYEFSTQPNKDMIINITKYDPVGGRIKGTFSGDLQSVNSVETATISSGTFEVRRDTDE